jgi:hypothetical protein
MSIIVAAFVMVPTSVQLRLTKRAADWWNRPYPKENPAQKVIGSSGFILARHQPLTQTVGLLSKGE